MYFIVNKLVNMITAICFLLVLATQLDIAMGKRGNCYATRWPHLAIDWGTWNYFAATTDAQTDTITPWNGADSSLTTRAAKVTSSTISTDFGTIQLGCLPAGNYRVSTTVIWANDRCAMNLTFAWSGGSKSVEWDTWKSSGTGAPTRANDIFLPANTTYTLNLKVGNTHAVSGGCYLVFNIKYLFINRIDSVMSSDTSGCDFTIWPHLTVPWFVYTYITNLGDTGAEVLFRWSTADWTLGSLINPISSHDFGSAYFGCLPAGLYRISADQDMDSNNCNMTLTLTTTGAASQTWSWDGYNSVSIGSKTRAVEINFTLNTTYSLQVTQANSRSFGGGCEPIWGHTTFFLDMINRIYA